MTLELKTSDVIRDCPMNHITQNFLDSIALYNKGVIVCDNFLVDRDIDTIYMHGYIVSISSVGCQQGKCKVTISQNSSRAKEFLRQGVILNYMQKYQLNYVEADTLYSAFLKTHGLPYENIVNYVIKYRDWGIWEKATTSGNIIKLMKHNGLPRISVKTFNIAARVICYWNKLRLNFN